MGIIRVVLVVGESFNFGLESVQPACRTYPQHALVVLEDCQYAVVTKAVGVFWIMSVVRELLRLPIKSVKPPAECRDPECPRSVFIDYLDVIAAQTLGIIGIVLVTGKLSCLSVESIEASTSCPDPEQACFVFVETPDEVAAQGVGIIGIFLDYSEAVAVVFVQTVFGTKPHEPLAVLQNAHNRALRQALFE